MINYEQKIKESGYKAFCNIAENILLRANDCIYLMGEEKFNDLVAAYERVLEDYKNDQIYKYYYELPKVKHGFCGFERWKLGLLF